jgi:Na+-driven multidrug efflux pump
MNAGILRGLGDSVASLVFLVISCLTNVILDFVFVAGFGMDVSGAALANPVPSAG